MTEAAETITEAMIPGQMVAEEHLEVGTVGVMTTEERAQYEDRCNKQDDGRDGVPEMIIGMIQIYPKDPN